MIWFLGCLFGFCLAYLLCGILMDRGPFIFDDAEFMDCEEMLDFAPTESELAEDEESGAVTMTEAVKLDWYLKGKGL